MLRFVRAVYRKLVPESIRGSAALTKLRAVVYSPRGMHDFVYNDDYYHNEVEDAASRSAVGISHSIVTDLAPASVVDVGCGTGALLAALRGHGCSVYGLEYSSAGLERCHRRDLDVTRFDLQKDEWSGDRRFDVAVSLEVAEHLPEETADRYVALLTDLADAIVFTAAPPGQGGWHHINEQPASYWLEKFATRGFVEDRALAEKWQGEWRDVKVESWYRENLHVLKRHGTAG